MVHNQSLWCRDMPFNPEDQYVHLSADGRATTTPGGDLFWSLSPEAMTKFEDGWLVSEFFCSENWGNWEMHPNAEEFIYLLSGDIELLQDYDGSVTSTRISGRSALLVPRGVWHTVRVFASSRMLFVTMGRGTQQRPVSET